MALVGVLTRPGVCAICKAALPVGEHVYHDSTKRQGSHLAHIKCWDDLRASRAGTPQEKPKAKPTQQSSEPLDPPF